MKTKAICGVFLLLAVLTAALLLTPFAALGPGADALTTVLFAPTGPGACIAAEAGPEVVEHYTGYLISRTERIGSKSEGPEYYLQTFDGREIHVVKNANLWEEDPELSKMIDRKVWISGTLTDGKLYYTKIKRLYG